MVECLVQVIKFLEQLCVLLPEGVTTTKMVILYIANGGKMLRCAIDNNIVVAIPVAVVLVFREFQSFLFYLCGMVDNMQMSTRWVNKMLKTMTAVGMMMKWQMVMVAAGLELWFRCFWKCC